eukprot:gene26223-31510_t
MLFWFLLAIPDALLRQAISGENPLLSLTEQQVGATRCNSMLDADTRAQIFADVPHLPGSAKPDPVLVADNVSRTFGGLKAVDVDHLEIQRGCITGLIGPNGAGKTTLFNLLTGFDRPDTGTWSMDGQSLGRMYPHQVARKGVVRTFQLTKALSKLTVLDNVRLGATGQRGERIFASLVPWIWKGQEREITEPVVDAYLGSHHDQALEFDDNGNPVGETAVLAAALAEAEVETLESGGDLSEPDVDNLPADLAATLESKAMSENHARSLTPAEFAATAEEHQRLSAGALLRADSLVAGYIPGVNILRECNFFLKEGEIVGIIGPNGAGKSTLLKSLFGLIPVREGSVTLREDNITSAPAHVLVQKGVGYVPQTQNVFQTLTIEENLEMGIYLRPKAFAERFAFDEVFIRCKKINAAGVSVIMVEQNARRCLQICDRGYVLDQGKNAYTDTGANLMNDPKVIELYLGTLAGSKEK